MGLFRTSAKKELKRAKKRAAANPSPLAYSTLADHYLLVADAEGALKAIQEGLETFPGSAMLERTLGSVKRRLLEEDFRGLHAQLAEEDTPDTMTRLARLYVETGEETKALEMCARTIEAFPDCEDGFVIVAGIRLRRFYKGLAIKDAIIAVANLERIISLNEQNYKAYQMLADLYLRIGLTSKAIQCLKTILVFTPDDEWTHQKLDEAIELPHREEESLETLLQEYREQNSLAAQAARLAEAAEGDETHDVDLPEHVLAGLKGLAGQSGFRSGVLLAGGSMGHETTAPEAEPVPMEEMVRSISQVAQRHSMRMDIGQFKKGVISGAFGQVVLQTSGDVVMGVLLEPGARLDTFENEVESIAEIAHAARKDLIANRTTSEKEGE